MADEEEAPKEEAPAREASEEGEAPAGEAPDGEAAEGEAREGGDPEGGNPEGEAPEGEPPEGGALKGEAPEGEAPEGEAPERETPAKDAEAPADGEEPPPQEALGDTEAAEPGITKEVADGENKGSRRTSEGDQKLGLRSSPTRVSESVRFSGDQLDKTPRGSVSQQDEGLQQSVSQLGQTPRGSVMQAVGSLRNSLGQLRQTMQGVATKQEGGVQNSVSQLDQNVHGLEISSDGSLRHSSNSLEKKRQSSIFKPDNRVSELEQTANEDEAASTRSSRRESLQAQCMIGRHPRSNGEKGDEEDQGEAAQSASPLRLSPRQSVVAAPQEVKSSSRRSSLLTTDRNMSPRTNQSQQDDELLLTPSLTIHDSRTLSRSVELLQSSSNLRRSSIALPATGSGTTQPSDELTAVSSGTKRPSGELAAVGSGVKRPSGALAPVNSETKRPSGELAAVGSGRKRPSGELIAGGSNSERPSGELLPAVSSQKRMSIALSAPTSNTDRPSAELQAVNSGTRRSSAEQSRPASVTIVAPEEAEYLQTASAVLGVVREDCICFCNGWSDHDKQMKELAEQLEDEDRRQQELNDLQCEYEQLMQQEKEQTLERQEEWRRQKRLELQRHIQMENELRTEREAMLKQKKLLLEQQKDVLLQRQKQLLDEQKMLEAQQSHKVLPDCMKPHPPTTPRPAGSTARRITNTTPDSDCIGAPSSCLKKKQPITFKYNQFSNCANCQCSGKDQKRPDQKGQDEARHCLRFSPPQGGVNASTADPSGGTKAMIAEPSESCQIINLCHKDWGYKSNAAQPKPTRLPMTEEEKGIESDECYSYIICKKCKVTKGPKIMEVMDVGPPPAPTPPLEPTLPSTTPTLAPTPSSTPLQSPAKSQEKGDDGVLKIPAKAPSPPSPSESSDDKEDTKKKRAKIEKSNDDREQENQKNRKKSKKNRADDVTDETSIASTTPTTPPLTRRRRNRSRSRSRGRQGRQPQHQQRPAMACPAPSQYNAATPCSCMVPSSMRHRHDCTTVDESEGTQSEARHRGSRGTVSGDSRCAVVLSNYQSEISFSEMSKEIAEMLHDLTGIKLSRHDVHLVPQRDRNGDDVIVYVSSEQDQRKIIEAIERSELDIDVKPYQFSSGQCSTSKDDGGRSGPGAAPGAGPGAGPGPGPAPGRCDRAPVCSRDCKQRAYTLGEIVGNETRQREFKCGQGLIESSLNETVGRYLSAFLNSDGGTLIYGVNDSGEVVGVPQCTFKREDILRQRIDQAIKTLRPSLFPHSYTVCFVPVVNRYGEPIENLKVIEICTEPGLAGDLYESLPGGGAFVRRDGSIQGPLKTADIQEWTKTALVNQRRRDKELENVKQEQRLVRAQLKEMKKQDSGSGTQDDVGGTIDGGLITSRRYHNENASPEEYVDTTQRSTTPQPSPPASPIPLPSLAPHPLPGDWRCTLPPPFAPLPGGCNGAPCLPVNGDQTFRGGCGPRCPCVVCSDPINWGSTKDQTPLVSHAGQFMSAGGQVSGQAACGFGVHDRQTPEQGTCGLGVSAQQGGPGFDGFGGTGQAMGGVCSSRNEPSCGGIGQPFNECGCVRGCRQVTDPYRTPNSMNPYRRAPYGRLNCNRECSRCRRCRWKEGCAIS